MFAWPVNLLVRITSTILDRPKVNMNLLVSLILGKPPGKVYGNLRTVASRMKERFWTGHWCILLGVGWRHIRKKHMHGVRWSSRFFKIQDTSRYVSCWSWFLSFEDTAFPIVSVWPPRCVSRIQTKSLSPTFQNNLCDPFYNSCLLHLFGPVFFHLSETIYWDFAGVQLYLLGTGLLYLV